MNRIIMIVAFLASAPFTEAMEKITVNSKLPDGNIIHPMPDSEGIPAVVAEFVSKREERALLSPFYKIAAYRPEN